jgi:hypothetical protein
MRQKLFIFNREISKSIAVPCPIRRHFHIKDTMGQRRVENSNRRAICIVQNLENWK